jgi:hypothetical protein
VPEIFHIYNIAHKNKKTKFYKKKIKKIEKIGYSAPCSGLK